MSRSTRGLTWFRIQYAVNHLANEKPELKPTCLTLIKAIHYNLTGDRLNDNPSLNITDWYDAYNEKPKKLVKNTDMQII